MKKTYVFDAYGTIFDVHSAVKGFADELGANAQAISDLWRTKQLEYTWVRSLMDADYHDFETLTQQALHFALAKFNMSNKSLENSLMQAYFTLKPYDEVPAMLLRLKERGIKTAILSNGSRVMLDAVVKSAKLDFDAVISVDDVKVFKPKACVYALINNHFSGSLNDISFFSSNRWDIAGATHFGIASTWVNRTNQPNEYPDLKPVKVISDLNGI